MFAFLRSTSLYLLAIPALFLFLGAATNQLVYVANHDKFPVVLNAEVAAIAADEGGMLDDRHCVATSETHLNFLADVFHVGHDHLSIGDLSIKLGDFLWIFAPYVFAFDTARKLRNYVVL